MQTIKTYLITLVFTDKTFKTISFDAIDDTQAYAYAQLICAATKAHDYTIVDSGDSKRMVA
jgi:hypothetical protein